MMKIFKNSLLILLSVVTVPMVWADGFKRAPVLDVYTQECASCHMAYPPALLPGASWQRIMTNLNKHYGVDASLDAASQKKISQWLSDNAATGKRASAEPPKDRITQSEWFLRKHNSHEVRPAVWKRASIGSPSNCNACHAQAAQGDFEEDKVRIPK